MNSWLDILSSVTWLPALAVLLPLLLLLRWRVYPHVPLAIAMVAPLLFSLLLLVRRDLMVIVLALDAGIVFVAALDLISIWRPAELTAERVMARVASIRKPHPVQILVTNGSDRNLRATIRDDLPQPFQAEPPEFDLLLRPHSRATLHYQMTASQRGAFELAVIHVRIRSRWGLWLRYYRLPVSSPIHVYPDMKQLGEYAVLARTNRLSLLGVRRTRRIGQDNEFERLRDYTVDDNYKHIDWRATARRSRLTVKDFQTNQSQRLIFMIDCGRMMTNTAAGLSLLDHALNSMLMLSYVALRQGDSVGLICFSDRIHSFVPPHSGAAQMNRLLHASFDQFPQLVESRYDEAFLYLSRNCAKRSLVVLVTNLIDEVNSNQIEQYLGSLVGKHLPLGVLLRDHALFELVQRTPQSDQDWYAGGAAAEIIGWRHQVLTDLTHRGVLALDVFPEGMTAPLINQYLNIKARHLL